MPRANGQVFSLALAVSPFSPFLDFPSRTLSRSSIVGLVPPSWITLCDPSGFVLWDMSFIPCVTLAIRVGIEAREGIPCVFKRGILLFVINCERATCIILSVSLFRPWGLLPLGRNIIVFRPMRWVIPFR